MSIERSRFGAVRSFNFTGWTDTEFRRMAVRNARAADGRPSADSTLPRSSRDATTWTVYTASESRRRTRCCASIRRLRR